MSAYSELAMATAGTATAGGTSALGTLGAVGSAIAPFALPAAVGLGAWNIYEQKKAKKEAKKEAQRQRRVEGAYNVASGIADVIQQHVERMTDFRIRAMAMNTMGKAGQLSPEQMWIASQ